jgi:hypothetical protein
MRERVSASWNVLARPWHQQITIGKGEVSRKPGEAGRKTRGKIESVAGRSGHRGANKPNLVGAQLRARGGAYSKPKRDLCSAMNWM